MWRSLFARGLRMLEWRLPLRAQAAASVLDVLRQDPGTQARLGDAGGPGVVRELVTDGPER